MGNSPRVSRKIQCHAVWRAVVVVLLVSGAAGPLDLAAQTGSTPPLVDYSAPYSLRSGDIIVPSAVLEMLLVNGDDLVLVALGAFDDPGAVRLDALARLEAETDGLVTVDAGSGDLSYWLDLVAIEQVPHGAFTLVRSAGRDVTITMFLAPVSTFAAGMAVAQQSVTVGGEPVFSGVEPAGLQSLLESALPQLESDAPEVARPDDEDAPTEESRGDSDEFDGMPGMVAEGVYVSPHHNVVLTWTGDWEFNDFLDAPVASDLNTDVDQVHLRTTGSTPVVFSMFAGPSGGENFSEIFEATTSQDFVQAQIDPSARVLDRRLMVNEYGGTVGAVIISVTIDGFDFVLYQELRLSDDERSLTLLEFLFLDDDLISGLNVARSLEFDGGRSVTAYTSIEIIDIVNQKNPIL